MYGETSFPAVDGVNVWPMLIAPQSYGIDAAHAQLVLSKEVLIAGKWKLLVSQPHFKSQNSGWKGPDGTWRPPNASETVPCMHQDASPETSSLPIPAPGMLPCLFDLRADPGEHSNVALANPDVVNQLWAALNHSIAYQRDCNGWSYSGANGGAIPGPMQPGQNGTSCSPAAKIGVCQVACSNALWASYGKADGPNCDVPGCNTTSAV